MRPNPFGLYDMHGNVSEMVEDCWHNNYEGAPTDGSAWTTDCDVIEINEAAVVRDGSWLHSPRALRSAARSWGMPWRRNVYLGFRLVQDINP